MKTGTAIGAFGLAIALSMAMGLSPPLAGAGEPNVESQRIDSPPSEVAFEDIHVVKLPKLPHYAYRGLGDIELLNDGRLLAVYSDSAKVPTGGIAARYSSDQGRTWGEEFALISPPAPTDPERATRYVHPGLLRLANGQLLLSYPYTTQVRPFHHAMTLYRRSLDDGKTWGDQFPMTPALAPNVAHNDKLIQLSTGRLVLPVEHETDLDNDHKGYASYVFLSDDNGYSWRKSDNEVNVLPIESQEPHVVELKDGRLMMILRTYEQCLGKSYSTDGGETWSKAELIRELKSSPNASPTNVKRIPSTGDLLLLRTTGGEGGRRTPFVAVISKDDGATWQNEKVIAGDPNDDYGYPSLTFVDDFALVFYHKRDGLYVARVGVDWLYQQPTQVTAAESKP